MRITTWELCSKNNYNKKNEDLKIQGGPKVAGKKKNRNLNLTFVLALKVQPQKIF